MELPEIKKFKDGEELKYVIKENCVANEMDVSINNIYRLSNPELPEIKIGETYLTEMIPWCYFEYKDIVWPVYSDDPGQQDIIYVNNKWYGAGAYNLNPVEEFVFIIDNYYKV